MSIWKIALRSIQQRGLASLLTTGSMALGVMLVVSVLSIHGVVSDQFRGNAGLGYNIIVGAKGGKLQLTMNSVYYLSQPIENIPYEYYLEFKRQEERDQGIQMALRGDAMRAQWDALEMQTAAASSGGPAGSHWLATLATTLAAEPYDARMDLGRHGKYGQFTAFAIPLCLGDYLGDYRVVGTTPDMFNKLAYSKKGRRQEYEFKSGRNFVYKSEEHGFFEAVLGSHVARKLRLGVGDQISPAHGSPEGHEHARKFTIVGILESTGTPNDRGVFINIEGFFLMDDHAKPIEAAATDDEEQEGDDDDDAEKEDENESSQGEDVAVEETPPIDQVDLKPLPLEQREVTAILIRTINPIVGAQLPTSINEGDTAQAVTPVSEIFNLFDRIVGPVQRLLFGLTIVICMVSGISILVSIYNSMNDRRQEIAVMRALGAGRGTILRVVLAESVILALAGGICGWILGHGVNWLASPMIEDQTGVTIGFFTLAPGFKLDEILGWDLEISYEILLIPSLIVLAIVVGLLPAAAAYRTDVAKSLGK